MAIDKASVQLFGSLPRSSPSMTRFFDIGAVQVAALDDCLKLAVAGPEDPPTEWYATSVQVGYDAAVEFAASIVAVAHEALADGGLPVPPALAALYEAAFPSED